MDSKIFGIRSRARWNPKSFIPISYTPYISRKYRLVRNFSSYLSWLLYSLFQYIKDMSRNAKYFLMFLSQRWYLHLRLAMQCKSYIFCYVARIARHMICFWLFSRHYAEQLYQYFSFCHLIYDDHTFISYVYGGNIPFKHLLRPSDWFQGGSVYMKSASWPLTWGDRVI